MTRVSNVFKIFSLKHLYIVVSFSQTPFTIFIVSAQFSELFSRMEKYQKQRGTDNRGRIITNNKPNESYHLLEVTTKLTKWN